MVMKPMVLTIGIKSGLISSCRDGAKIRTGYHKMTKIRITPSLQDGRVVYDIP